MAVPIFTFFVSICGICGHTLTLLMLYRLKFSLKRHLDLLTWRLMSGQALCEILICAIGEPLVIWNTLSARQWPFTVPFVCYYPVYALYNLVYVSLNHSMVIAVLRFMAVFMPVSYSRLTRATQRRRSLWLLSLFPWIPSNALFLFGYIFSAYLCNSEGDNDICNVAPVNNVDNLESAQRRFITFLAIRALCEVLLPLLISCSMYGSVLWRLRSSSNQRRIALTATATSASNTVSVQQQQLASTATVTVAWAESGGGDGRTAQTTAAAAATATGSNNITAAVTHAQRSRNRAVKVLAAACFTTIILMYPLPISQVTSIYYVFLRKAPVLVDILWMMYSFTYCATPFVYAISSPQMRTVYWQIIRDIFGCCCRCKCSKTTATGESREGASKPDGRDSAATTQIRLSKLESDNGGDGNKRQMVD